MRITFREYLVFALVAWVIVWLNRFHFFFWDTVQLTSMHAHWFYEQDFSTFFLPRKYDSGHPPFWGLYHAFLWKVFGKSLITSHLAIWPFIFGSMVFLGKIGAHLTQHKYAGLLFGLFFLADPVLFTQSTLVSPDVALICFFLMTLYGILRQREGLNWPIILGAIGLSLISLRGMMTLAGLGLLVMINFGFRKGLRQMLPFLPGIIVGIGFLVIHSFHTKWIGYHEDSPWAESFQLVGLKGFAKNVAVLIWRFVDVGRIFVWLAIGVIGYRSNWRKESFGQWIKIFLVLSLVLLPTFLIYNGLSGMRYLMPLFVVVNLLLLQLIFLLQKQGFRRWFVVYIFVFIAFGFGNLWKYPANISVSWDTTMLHLPYYHLREKMMDFIDQEDIPITQIATAFPNTAPLEIIDLNANPKRMIAMDDHHAKYYVVSNIFNDVKNDLSRIQSECTLLKRYESRPIWIALYQIK